MTSSSRAVQRGAMLGERARTAMPKKRKVVRRTMDPPAMVKPMACRVGPTSTGVGMVSLLLCQCVCGL